MKHGVLLISLLLSSCLFSPASESDAGSGSDLGIVDGGDMGSAPDSAGGDVTIPQLCGDGALQANETCDPMLPDTSPGACPTSCDDGEACTADAIVGAAITCDAACQSTVIETCQNDDGCCPGNCDSSNDTDCDDAAVCGDGIVTSPAETCDAGIDAFVDGGCPKTEDCAPMICANARVLGSRSNCDAECDYVDITVCRDDDGCCPGGCTAASDNDCTIGCGNGTIDAGETCDGNCPTSAADCDDGNACTDDMVLGDANACNAECVWLAIGVCQDGDLCCPAQCDSTSDSDCSDSCGNGSVEPNETCDDSVPAQMCPTDCDDADSCTADSATGSPSNCNVQCTSAPIGACANDGCCPAICDATNDPDCSPVCGNSVVEMGETCDGNCPVSCDDADACTTDASSGTAGMCDRVCTSTPVTACQMASDGCCPDNCNATNDGDCQPQCGNGVVEGMERCDGDCPASCNDANACTLDSRTGQSSSCNVECNYVAIQQCIDADGCCPQGCTSANDNDCSASCGNNIVEGMELCDGNCPTAGSCQAMGACYTLSGNAGNCDAQCTMIGGCVECDPNGNCPCASGQTCISGVCENSTGGECEDACDPVSYCLTHAGAPLCDATGQCVFCASDLDCQDHEKCSGGYCEDANHCAEAADPDGYCLYFLLGNSCNFQTQSCDATCVDDNECGPVEQCVGGFCQFAASCEKANDPDAWCGGPGAVCFNSECQLECFMGDACDCPVYETCLPIPSSSRFYCEPSPPAFCWEMCLLDQHAWCVDQYGPGAYCLNQVQLDQGCIPGTLQDVGGTDGGPPPPDAGGGMPDLPVPD